MALNCVNNVGPFLTDSSSDEEEKRAPVGNRSRRHRPNPNSPPSPEWMGEYPIHPRPRPVAFSPMSTGGRRQNNPPVRPRPSIAPEPQNPATSFSRLVANERWVSALPQDPAGRPFPQRPPSPSPPSPPPPGNYRHGTPSSSEGSSASERSETYSSGQASTVSSAPSQDDSQGGNSYSSFSSRSTDWTEYDEPESP